MCYICINAFFTKNIYCEKYINFYCIMLVFVVIDGASFNFKFRATYSQGKYILDLEGKVIENNVHSIKLYAHN